MLILLFESGETDFRFIRSEENVQKFATKLINKISYTKACNRPTFLMYFFVFEMQF